MRVTTLAVIVLIVLVVGITAAVVVHLGYGIKLDADHRRRLARRDRQRARLGGRARRRI
jgi:hypothetical protein